MLRVIFVFTFSAILFPQCLHALNNQMFNFTEDYDIQSIEFGELEETEEEVEESSLDNLFRNKHIVLVNKITLSDSLLFVHRTFLSNQKKIYTPPPEFCSF